MTRLIDADALLIELNGACSNWQDDCLVAEIVNNAPTADRPSGEWQRVDEQPYFRKHYHKVCCSVCHKQGSKKYNYCPSCGARMNMKGANNG